jgi:hypothetical protein
VRGALLLALLLLPAVARAQDVVVRDAGGGQGAAIVRRVVAGPHVVRAGTAPLELPRDSTITSSLLVLGRTTYVASRVQGDVVVVGADLHLRPGADVSGRAVAIGGTVTETSLGRVAGGVVSLRDETYAVQSDGDRWLLDFRSLRVEDREPLIRLAGMEGVKLPGYDRVDGLSLPVGVVFQFGNHALELEPYVTYRSRLGVVDGALEVRTRDTSAFRLVGRVARDTRTNDRWIRADLLNSAAVLITGSDTRNYFRSDLGEARVVRRIVRGDFTLEPYVGGRLERVSPITATGNVWSLLYRNDSNKVARPNPLVEAGNIGSALVGAALSTTGFVTSVAYADIEQGFSAPAGTSTFTQLTVGGGVELPTFAAQVLKMRAHGVATRGRTVPMARYAYLGGSGTLRTLDLLEEGGSALLFVESRYLIPIERIQLPFVGQPVLILRDAFGGAGVGTLPGLQHEIGVGLGLSAVRVEYNVAVAGRSGHEFGFGLSLAQF